MTPPDPFAQAFAMATGGADPYPWQAALAARGEPAAAIDAPTGSGKTEAVVLDWLWRRRLGADPGVRAVTPRRLVLALPMRVLVEQTLNRVSAIVARLESGGLLDPEDPVRVAMLLGGARDDEWTLHPADDQVIVATIDMALSRALNRGYGRGRSAWPIDFGLMGSDTQWVLDEVQLLDAALATSAQLAGFRDDPALTAGGTPRSRTTWMSATLDPGWLDTLDHPAPQAASVHALTAADETGPLGERLRGPKTLHRVELDLADTAAIADAVRSAHAEVDNGNGTGEWLTIALCNTVVRAQALHARLAAAGTGAELLLLHSRFRPPDRERLLERLSDPVPSGGRIVVTTQVIEAGVDLDAGALVTELAPWASIVQRAGRLNRAGRRTEATLTWLDPPESELSDKIAAPYDPGDLSAAREALRDLDGASFAPRDVRAHASQRRSAGLLRRPRMGLLLRRRDLLGLFDTDPTLDGDDADVGAFIRLGDDLDVTLAWRDLGSGPPADDEAPRREELCPVPLSERRAIANRRPWRWSYRARRWEQVASDERLVPGDVLLLDATAGGYRPAVGWDPQATEPVPPIAVVALADDTAPRAGDDPAAENDSDDADPTSEGDWLTIAEHTDHVADALGRDLDRLALPAGQQAALRLAARYHDVGKAHPRFQARMLDGAVPPREDELWAKGSGARRPRDRKVLRHEVASVLLMLAEHDGEDEVVELAAYLVAAHHGKLRLAPRLAPTASTADGAAARQCLGIVEGEPIPARDAEGEQRGIDAGAGVTVPPLLEADLSLFDLGSLEQRVWLDRSLALLDRLGPFRLAYLEALLRAADQRASREERRGG